MSSRYLSINEMLQQPSSAPLYVINTSQKSELGQKGEVLLQIPALNSNAEPAKITVPQSWLPMDLTQSAPREQVLMSTEFRRAVNIGLITPCSADHAQRLEEQPGAREERQRLREARNMLKKVQAARTIANSGATISRADNVTNDDAVDIVDGNGRVHRNPADLNVAQQAAAGLSKVNGLDQNFILWADRVAIKDDVSALNEIRGYGSMTRRMLKHMTRTLNGQPQTQAYVQKRLDKLDTKRKVA